MKLLIACVVAAAAGAVAPPKISLDLAKGSLVRTLKGAVPHPEGLLQPDGTPVTSRQDWSEECAASTATSEGTCPFPQARAFDHNDLSIEVRENIWLVDQAGQTMAKTVSRSEVQFDKPAVYLFKFDATDSAGNHAEQVVFSLILNDVTKPVIRTIGALEETWRGTDRQGRPLLQRWPRAGAHDGCRATEPPTIPSGGGGSLSLSALEFIISATSAATSTESVVPASAPRSYTIPPLS